MRFAAALLITLAAGHAAPARAEIHVKVRHVERLNHPHGYAFDFVKRGDFVFHTNAESDRKLGVIDVSNPAAPRIVASVLLPRYRSDDICLWRDLVLIGLPPFVFPVDVSEPRTPRPLAELAFTPDPDVKEDVYYEFETAGDLLLLASPDPSRALRIYRIEPPFRPRLLSTVDLSLRLTESEKALLSLKNRFGLRAVKDLIVSGDRVHVAYASCVLGVRLADPARPAIEYLYHPRAYIESIALAGDRLFVATSDRGTADRAAANPELREPRVMPTRSPRGIVCLNLASPGGPTEIDAYGRLQVPERLLVNGNVLYAVGREFMTHDAARVDGVELPPRFEQDVFAWRAVMHAIDLRDGAMKTVGRVALPLQYRVHGQSDVSVSCKLIADGHRLFVGEQGFGLRVFDVRDSLDPRPLGGVCTVFGETNGLVLRGADVLLCGYHRVFEVNARFASASAAAPDGGLAFPMSMACRAMPAGERYLFAPPLSVPQAVAAYDLSSFAQPKLAGLTMLPEGQNARLMTCVGPRIFLLAMDHGDRRLVLREFRADGSRLSGVSELPLALLERPADLWSSALFGADDRRARVLVKAVDSAGKPKPLILTADITADRPAKLLGVAALPFVEGGVWRYPNRFFQGDVAYCYGGPAGKPTLYTIDLADPAHPRKLAESTERAGRADNYYSDLLTLDPHPLVAVQNYFVGLRIFDVSDPAEPRLIWKEPPGEKQDFYAAIGWSAGLWWNGKLYVPRLDHLDVFEVSITSPAPP